MKCKTFILKCFLQFTCTNVDGSQKEGGNFLNLLQKEGGVGRGPRKRVFPQKRWVPNPQETMIKCDLVCENQRLDSGPIAWLIIWDQLAQNLFLGSRTQGQGIF